MRTVMVGLVPAIDASALPRQMAGTSPAMTLVTPRVWSPLP